MPSISLPTAALVAGGLSAAGAVASGVMGSNAAKSAAQTQANSAKYAADLQHSQFEETQNNLKPFLTTGASALPALAKLAGGSGSGEMLNTLKSLPGYQFQLDQGLKASQNGYAAQGLGASGAAQKGAADYAEGLAGTSYQGLFNNIYNTANLGLNAGTQIGNFGQQSVTNQGNLLTSGAAATAAGQVGSANAITGAVNGVANGLGSTALIYGLNSAGMFGPKGAGGSAGMMTPNQLSAWGAST